MLLENALHGLFSIKLTFLGYAILGHDFPWVMLFVECGHFAIVGGEDVDIASPPWTTKEVETQMLESFCTKDAL